MQANQSYIKMILETAQLLSDAVRSYGYASPDVYKGAYHNHPSAVWARRNQANFNWLAQHGLALCQLFYKKTGKQHKSLAIIARCAQLSYLLPPSQLKFYHYDLAIKSTPEGLFALEIFKNSKGELDDAAFAYQIFYSAKWYVKKEFKLNNPQLAWAKRFYF